MANLACRFRLNSGDRHEQHDFDAAAPEIRELVGLRRKTIVPDSCVDIRAQACSKSARHDGCSVNYARIKGDYASLTGGVYQK